MPGGLLSSLIRAQGNGATCTKSELVSGERGCTRSPGPGDCSLIQ